MVGRRGKSSEVTEYATVAFLDIRFLLASQQYEDECTTAADFTEERYELLLLKLVRK